MSGSRAGQPGGRAKRQGRGRPTTAAFWGDASSAQPVTSRTGRTPDPAALLRSLGTPPLAVNPSVATGTLEAVYEEVVRAAAALAAAGGLLADDDAAQPTI